MSSLIAANANEGERILPEVEELSQFHPDELSSLADIQEELDKLEASDHVGVDEVMSLSTVDDVNVVDHEVTIVAEQINDGTSILPEISENLGSPQEVDFEEEIPNDSFDSIIRRNFTAEETNATKLKEQDKLEMEIGNSITQSSCNDVILNSVSNSAIGYVAKQKMVDVSNLRSLTSLAKAPSENKTNLLAGMNQPKKGIVTKLIFTPNSQAASDAPIIFGEAGGQTIKLLGQNKAIITNTSKTITFAQAKGMGLLSPGKMHTILPNQSKGMVKKSLVMNSTKTLTMLKSSPTKILPLPTNAQLQSIAPSSALSTSTSQKIIIRQAPSIKTGSFSNAVLTSNAAANQSQILQLPVSQENVNNHQIHQIQLPGKQVQYLRLAVSSAGVLEAISKPEPMMTATGTGRPVPVALTTTSQIKMMPLVSSASSLQNSNSFERVIVSPGLSQLAGKKQDAKPHTGNIVMVPAEFVKQFSPVSAPSLAPAPSQPASVTSSKSTPSPPTSVISSTSSVPSPPLPNLTATSRSKEMFTQRENVVLPQSHKKISSDTHNGIRPRKPCNCTKSQCLKLYCDCFANGEFCFQCNCNCCFNNLNHEEERQKAIKACLERNPNAFRPKIGKGYVGDERRHNKGCNCKRSGCLKNYCECYEAKIPCSNNCKCVGCRNIEETRGIGTDANKVNQQMSVKSRLSSELQESVYKSHSFLVNLGSRQPSNLMTQEVVEATCQCLLAQVESKDKLTDQVERLILEEFGRCLVEIIEYATRTTVNSGT